MPTSLLPFFTRPFTFLAMGACAVFTCGCGGEKNADPKPASAPAPTARASDDLPAQIRFNAHIRPIMSNTCFACHGPDVKSNKAGLRLDHFESATAPLPEHKEHRAIVPGNSAASEAWKRINSTDPKEQMPPPDFKNQLTERDKRLIAKWIEQGAKYEDHWAYVVPQRPEVPKISGSTVANPVDAFVQQRLAAEGLKPSPLAPKAAEIRRLTLDLTGLPPTPEEAAAYEADSSPGAYGKLVDRLLASPRFGERLAVPYLDWVRFSDTVGFHGDQNQHIFPYRDYVISSFNTNKPYDKFVTEQIAGDLLPHPTEEQLVASGFNRLNMMTREGGAQPKEYLAVYTADRVRTIGTAFLGSTLACCECHDHKYDPFSAKDFYSLGAFFADVKQWGVYSHYNSSPDAELKALGFSNESPFPPEIRIKSPSLLARLEKLWKNAAELAAADTAGNTSFDAEAKAWAATVSPLAASGGWLTLPLGQLKANLGSTPKLQPDGSVLFDGPVRESAQKNDKDPKAKATTAPEIFTLDAGRIPFPINVIRVEALPDPAHGGRIARADRKALSFDLKIARVDAQGKVTDSAFREATTDHWGPRSHSSGTPRPIHMVRWLTNPDDDQKTATSWWFLDKPLALAPGETLQVRFSDAQIGRVRLSVSPFADNPDLFPQTAQNLAAATPEKLRALFALHAGKLSEKAAPLYAKIRQSITDCNGGLAWTLITRQTDKPLTIRVLARGNWMDESGPVVQPNPPKFLSDAGTEQRPLNRLDLAKWLTSPENPLTARVFVNRVWKHLLGKGLSDTVDDLGNQGEWPSHPELLDWLAVEFREAWDVKKLVRTIVTSHTYRQDTKADASLRERDPNNRLLARQVPRRLDAEFIRDNALAVSGLLNGEIGGPSAFPYQPDDYYANIQFPDRTYRNSTDDRQWRRGLYAHWQRTFLHPMMANFDAPSREEACADRLPSTTPLQALTLLNDPAFVEMARALAVRLHRENLADDSARLERAFRLTLSRRPSPEESSGLLKLLTTQREAWKATPEDTAKFLAIGNYREGSELAPHELAAWTSLARVVLNLSETITRP